MKNKELYKLRDGINKISHLGGADFAIAVVKNLRLVEQEIEVLDTLIKPSKEYQEIYLPEVEKLAREFCSKDKDGNPMVTYTNERKIYYEFTPLERLRFDNEVKNLENDAKFGKVITERERQEDKYNEALEKECTVAFNKIKKEIIPKDIKVGELNDICYILEEL